MKRKSCGMIQCGWRFPARASDEPRHLVIGAIGDEYWSAVITYRNSNIRLISVRRSRKEESALYESL
jgi:uncharacterized DUF497 family protein